MIKRLAIFMLLGITSTIWASEAVTIQVINAVYEKSVTKEFEARLKKSGLSVHKKVENGHHIVTLGNFKDKESARNALKKVRFVVTNDAFLRPVNRHNTAVAQTKTQPAVHVTAVEHKTAAPSAVTTPVTVVVTTTAPSSTTQAVKPSVKAAPSECDKRELHKDEFAEAIRYYKTSPYHRFEPVVLRQ